MERAVHARCPTPVAPATVRKLLTTRRRSLLTTVDEPDIPEGLHLTELSVEVVGVPAVRQQVVVQLDEPEDDEGGGAVRWPIRWHPVSHARALPTMSGTLTAEPTPTGSDLVLDGSYRPPLGQIGKFADGVVGHRVARSCTNAFVADLARRIELEAVADAAEEARRSAG